MAKKHDDDVVGVARPAPTSEENLARPTEEGEPAMSSPEPTATSASVPPYDLTPPTTPSSSPPEPHRAFDTSSRNDALAALFGIAIIGLLVYFAARAGGRHGALQVLLTKG